MEKIMAYEFEMVNGRLVGKGNYPWRKLAICKNEAFAQSIALALERKTGHACKSDMEAIWIQGDKTEAVAQALADACGEAILVDALS